MSGHVVAGIEVLKNQKRLTNKKWERGGGGEKCGSGTHSKAKFTLSKKAKRKRLMKELRRVRREIEKLRRGTVCVRPLTCSTPRVQVLQHTIHPRDPTAEHAGKTAVSLAPFCMHVATQMVTPSLCDYICRSSSQFSSPCDRYVHSLARCFSTLTLLSLYVPPTPDSQDGRHWPPLRHGDEYSNGSGRLLLSTARVPVVRSCWQILRVVGASRHWQGKPSWSLLK